MCAQFEVKFNSKSFALLVNGPDADDDFFYERRVLPYTPSLVLLKNQDQYKLTMKEMSFSLVPSWSKTKKVSFATHNARVETITEKDTWKVPFKSRRCIVPLNSFIEPIYENEFAGNMVKFSQASGDVLFAGGLWDQWVDKQSGEIFESFTIITRPPLKYIEEAGHDRSPIFLEQDYFNDWLNPAMKEKELLDLLHAQKDNKEWVAAIDRPLKNFSNQLKLF
jgi:putative SOS response-associated peptidase YedK